MKTLTPALAMRYNRQISLPGVDLSGQEQLLNSRVLQIGVGGLGCASAQNLVGAGVGAITLVDDDIVELTNIHRQVLHTEQDVGRAKVYSAQESLQAMNPDCDISPLSMRLDDEALMAQINLADVVLDCCDNLASRQQINRLCWQAKKPLVSGAAIRMEGQLACFSAADNSPCYGCLSHLFGEPSLSCAEAGVLPPVVNIVGSMQAMQAIKILVGLGEVHYGQLQLFDFLSGQWRSFTVNRYPDCAVCGN